MVIIRKFFIPLYIQFNMELDLINSLRHKNVKLHEKFIVKNFKGVLSPFKKLSENDNKPKFSSCENFFFFNKKLYFTNIIYSLIILHF